MRKLKMEQMQNRLKSDLAMNFIYVQA